MLLAACGGGSPVSGWSSPTVSNGVIYVGGSNARLYAIDPAALKINWSKPDPGGSFVGIYGTPAVDNGTVYFGAMDGNLYALEASKGDIKWKFDANSGAATDKKGIVPGPVVADNVIYVGANNHVFYAINAVDGSLKWQFPTREKNWGDAAVANETIYFGSLDHTLYALDLDGNKKWGFDAGGIIVDRPLVANEVVYFGALERLFALDAATGNIKWQQTLDPDHWIWSNPTIQENVIYVGDLGGQVHAFDAGTGTPKWSKPFEIAQQEPGRAVRSSVVISGTMAFFGAGSNTDPNAQVGRVYALDANSGELKWSFPAFNEAARIGSVLSTPAVDGDKLYVLTRADSFLVLNAANGVEQQSLDLSTGGQPAPTPNKGPAPSARDQQLRPRPGRGSVQVAAGSNVMQ